jgi:apolipoprotein N-acyltransferase
VVAQSGFGEPAILSAQIVPRQDTTPYQRFGDAFAFGCAAWVAVVSALRSRRRGASAADARTAGATEQETS